MCNTLGLQVGVVVVVHNKILILFKMYASLAKMAVSSPAMRKMAFKAAQSPAMREMAFKAAQNPNMQKMALQQMKLNNKKIMEAATKMQNITK